MKKVFFLMSLVLNAGVQTQPSYDDWKNEQDSQFKQAQLSDPLEQAIELLARIHGLAMRSEKDRETNLCFLYHYITEKIKRKNGCEDCTIDWQWLYDVYEELLTLWVLEDADSVDQGMARALEGQRDILEKIKREYRIPVPVALLATDTEGGLQTSYYLALCRHEDPQSWLATGYHEMAHILHDDSKKRNQVAWQEESAEELLKDSSLQEALRLSKEYVEIGKKVVKATTRIGAQLKPIAQSTSTFYRLPKDADERAYFMLVRAQEQRADLWEFKKLEEHGELMVFCQELYFYAMSNQPIVSSNPWPSDAERALCMLGFLHEQGIDVNELLERCQSHEICLPQPESVTFQALAQGTSDARSAYVAWRQEISLA